MNSVTFSGNFPPFTYIYSRRDIGYSSVLIEKSDGLETCPHTERSARICALRRFDRLVTPMPLMSWATASDTAALVSLIKAVLDSACRFGAITSLPNTCVAPEAASRR